MGAAATDAVAERRPGESLRASAVSRSFAGVRALSDVTLEVRRNEVVGLIGPNGAGKSTLVNVLSGFDRPDSGAVELEGRTITRWSPHRRARAGVARTFQHSHSFKAMTVRENIEIASLGSGHGQPRATTLAIELAHRLGLDEDALAGQLAHGHERLLGMARAMATEPSYVLLDEPGAGVPEAEVGELAEFVTAMKEDFNAGVLLIDHNMALVMEVCDRVQVLDQGRTLAEGTPAEIRANLDVGAAYLGESGADA